MPNRQAPEIEVDGTLFTFPESWEVEVFDQWQQYRVASRWGLPGCDVVALAGDTLWLIEMKDYTYPGAAQPPDLIELVGRKAAGTLGLLFGLGDAHEFARRSRDVSVIRIALHIEVKDGGRKERQIEPLLVPLQQRLRAVAKTLGSKAHVSSTLAPGEIPWRARRNPATRARHQDR